VMREMRDTSSEVLASQYDCIIFLAMNTYELEYTFFRNFILCTIPDTIRKTRLSDSYIHLSLSTRTATSWLYMGFPDRDEEGGNGPTVTALKYLASEYLKLTGGPFTISQRTHSSKILKKCYQIESCCQNLCLRKFSMGRP